MRKSFLLLSIILTTILHNRQIPDPLFGMNNNLIPDVYETGRDYYTYWFYKEFELPTVGEDQNVSISNREKETAFFIRLKVLNNDGSLALPAYFSENYLTLFPDDEKRITLDLSAVARSAWNTDLKLVTEGWNTAPSEVKIE
jgi:hypothetical protein